MQDEIKMMKNTIDELYIKKRDIDKEIVNLIKKIACKRFNVVEGEAVLFNGKNSTCEKWRYKF